jgi:hypothetical protein
MEEEEEIEQSSQTAECLLKEKWMALVVGLNILL